MSTATAMKEKPEAGAKPKKLAYGSQANAKYVEGRRAFFKYRELGVTEATDGLMRAQITSGEKGMTEPTGWHYHTCDAQFIYMLKGWVDLVFEDGQQIRVTEGESLYIPGGLKHNETATSDDIDILEVSIPAEMGTVPCEAPEGMK